MLYPTVTDSRSLTDLSGVWKFKIDKEDQSVVPGNPIEADELIAVPGSYNDQIADGKDRLHSGYFWYETSFKLPKALREERLVLRFGSATHEAWVYLNGKEITHHKGGFTPFEVEINDYLVEGENLLQVHLSNILDYTTLPVGNYSETADTQGNVVRKVDENFDFFNYSGIHRPVKVYSTPFDYISDIVIVPNVNHDNNSAEINLKVEAVGDYDEVRYTVIDEEGNVVVTGEGIETSVIINAVNLWQPLNAYLYDLKVDLVKNGEVVDTYTEPFGVRSVEVKDGKFLINNEPFYFKGFGKHEDSYINGKGLNEAVNVLDFNLMKKMGANSFRTSHYPYSEELMRLADREGFVVIDEVPAVGVMHSFDFNISAERNASDDVTFTVMDTEASHRQVIEELIKRDKNHACVVMWSIANESAQYANDAAEYYEPLFNLARELDPQKRPLTQVNILYSLPDADNCAYLADVICLNRYYGWYLDLGDLDKAAADLKAELDRWKELYPDKPVVFTEYGVDTVAGFHSSYEEPFSEEFQERYYEVYHEVFDQCDNVQGEQLWNFADFQTKYGIFRVQGNKKGVFTREREPKAVVRHLSKRWNSIPNFNYK